MCLAIAPVESERKGRLARLWQPLSATPLRLFSLGAVLHGLVLAVLTAAGGLAGAQALDGARFLLFYGIGGLVLLGFLLTWLPARFNREPVHYVWYTGVWMFMLAGMTLLEIGLVSGVGWSVVGAGLMLLAWLLALRAYHWVSLWVWGRSGRLLKAQLLMLVAAAVVGIPVYALALMSGGGSLSRYPHGVVFLALVVIAAIVVRSVGSTAVTDRCQPDTRGGHVTY